MTQDQDTQDKPIDYKAHQSAKEEAYAGEFSSWMNSLTPSEREALKAKGITGPLIEPQGVGGPELDTDRLASPAEAPAPDVDPLDYDDPRVMSLAMEMVRAVVGELVTSTNKSLSVECFALVTGIAYTGMSQTEIGKRHGVTRAAVSKRCVELTEKLGLNPSRAMKSTEARQSCSAAQYEAREEWREHENWEKSPENI